MASKRALERARGLVGTPFRPQGRDPSIGIDCIGLAMLAFRLGPEAVPDDYRLSSRYRDGDVLAMVERRFRRVPRGRPGNLVVMTMGSRQTHFGIVSDVGLIHADARRRLVVEAPMPSGARVIGTYRLRRFPQAEGAR